MPAVRRTSDHDQLTTLKEKLEGHLDVCTAAAVRNTVEHSALGKSIDTVRNWIFGVLAAALLGAGASLWDKVFP